MSSNLLTWLAAGLIAVVLASTLWMAHAIRPEQGSSAVMVAQAPAAAASAPARP
ncbi:hypothetical protein [Roseateles puraquae]|jgi:hypothetical protein|uniref:hypothetical protein n=1 Tax=Roseateles puraquae TaxID=431059 RepID=UPI0013034011|nr:hypothetical protein [Roseateles puraquae]